MTEDHVERREYLRIEVYLDELQVTVGIHGIEPTKGMVLDVSRGGMKVCLEHEIPKPLAGYDCLVRFEDPRDGVGASQVGKLLRMESAGQYVIEFDCPLERRRRSRQRFHGRSCDRPRRWRRVLRPRGV